MKINGILEKSHRFSVKNPIISPYKVRGPNVHGGEELMGILHQEGGLTAANTQTRPTEVYLWHVCRGVPSEREGYQFVDS